MVKWREASRISFALVVRAARYFSGAFAVHASRSPIYSRPLLRVSAGALIAFGVVVALLAIFADTIGIGGGSGFGYMQLIALIAGIIFILGGLAIAFQRFLRASTRDSFENER